MPRHLSRHVAFVHAFVDPFRWARQCASSAVNAVADLAGFAIFYRLSKRARAREGVADFLAPRVFFGGFDLDLVPWLEKKITDSLRSSASL
jgi:hypothetical protein